MCVFMHICVSMYVCAYMHSLTRFVSLEPIFG